jgi:uncharacterized protein (TIGR03000 family)
MIRKAALMMVLAGLGLAVWAAPTSACHRWGRRSCRMPCVYPSTPCTTTTPAASTGKDTTDSSAATGDTTDEASAGDPVSAEEEKQFNTMYEGTPAEDLKALQKGWAEKSHAQRKEVWDKYQKVVKDAEEKANKKQKEKEDKEGGKEDGKEDGKDGSAKDKNDTAARLIVKLPADAELTIDDHLMQGTSDRRVFDTPPLQKGLTYVFKLKATVVRNGRTMTATRELLFKAASLSEVSFEFPENAVALK